MQQHDRKETELWWGSEITSINEAVPLLSSKTSIRLLEILVDDDSSRKGPEDAIISCSLYTANLDKKPAYTALSYMWGDDAATKTIQVNGQSFQVRENLWDFLDRLRKVKQAHTTLAGPSNNIESTTPPAHSLPLWIDAICIDQSLISEKNHQVWMMDKIFSRAQVVVSWLGRGNDSLYKGMEIANMSRYESPGLLPQKSLPELSQVYDHPYWRRVWVMQEVILSRRLEIWCGPTTLDEDGAWCGVRLFSKILGKNSSKAQYSYSLLWHRLMNKLELRSYYVVGSFGDTLLLARHSACEDIRDRVYAILSLLDPEDRARLDIQPEYSKTIDELFQEVSSKIWTRLVRYDRKAFKKYLVVLGSALECPPSFMALDTDKLHDAYPSMPSRVQISIRTLRMKMKRLIIRIEKLLG